MASGSAAFRRLTLQRPGLVHDEVSTAFEAMRLECARMRAKVANEAADVRSRRDEA